MDLTADEIKKFIDQSIDFSSEDIGSELASYIEDIIRIKLGGKAGFVKVRCGFDKGRGDSASLTLSIDTNDSDLMTMAEDIANEVLESLEGS